MPDNRNNRYNSGRAGAGSGRPTRRQSGRVPPLDAFDNTPKRRPPNLPGNPDFDPNADATGRPKNVSRGSTGNTVRMPVVNSGGGQAGRGTRAKNNAARSNGGGQARQGNRQGGKKQNTNAKRNNKKRKKPLTRKQKKRRNFLVALVSMLVIVVAGIWFSFSVLFKIDGYVIEGSSPYSEEEIISSFGKQIEDNMFSYRAGESARRMEHELPYLANVKITRKLPGTVVITVQEAKECYTLQWGGEYLVLGAAPGLKVLRTAEQAPEGLTELYGLSDLVAETGYGLQLTPLDKDEEYNLWQELAQPPVSSYEQPQTLPESIPQQEGEETEGGEGENEAGGEGETPTNGETADGEGQEGEPEEGAQGEPEESNPDPDPVEAAPQPVELAQPTQRLEVMVQLLTLLHENEITDVEWINVTDTLDLQFRWESRVTVKLGAPSSMAENLTAALVIMRQQLSSSDYGVLDVSTYTATLQSVFSPETPAQTASQTEEPESGEEPEGAAGDDPDEQGQDEAA